MEDLLVQMGKRMRKRRKQLRLTQEELAEKAGITLQTVSTAELGKKAMKPEIHCGNLILTILAG